VSETSLPSHNAWKGEAYDDRMGHKSQKHTGFHNSDSDSDYDEDEGADSEGEETNEETESEHVREDRSIYSSDQSYNQYGHRRPTSHCSSVVCLLLVGENLNR
jgi:hypothetical protein